MGRGEDEIREISEVSGKAATGVKLCEHVQKKERSALVARECRRNLMHEMDGMLEAWLGARGTHSLTQADGRSRLVGGKCGRWQSQVQSRHRASKKCRTHHKHPRPSGSVCLGFTHSLSNERTTNEAPGRRRLVPNSKSRPRLGDLHVAKRAK